jgi:hypothetical protein
VDLYSLDGMERWKVILFEQISNINKQQTSKMQWMKDQGCEKCEASGKKVRHGHAYSKLDSSLAS